MTRDAVTSDQPPASGLPFSMAVRGGGLRVGVYLTDMSQFGAMNEAYRRHFAEPYPARTTIGVAALPLGAAVEMDVVVG